MIGINISGPEEGPHGAEAQILREGCQKDISNVSNLVGSGSI